MRISTLLAIFTILIAGCATKSTTLEIAGKEVFDGSLVICNAQVRSDGIKITVDGVKVAGTVNRNEYAIGKPEYSEGSTEQLSNIASSVDRIFAQMCSSTVSLRDEGAALANYVVLRDENALKIMAMLSEIESVNNETGLSEEDAVKKQIEISTPVLEETESATKL